MHRFFWVAASLAATFFFSIDAASAQSRVALVIANSAYQNAPPLKTTAADAGLIATTLKAAGYDVVEASDSTKATIGDSIRSFLDKVTAGGPDTVAFVYYAGYGVQYNGDSYLVPVDAQIATADAVANEALPLSALIAALAPLPAAARIIVLDASRDGGFGRGGAQPLPPGLALVGVPPGFLLAYAAAPGAVMCSCGDANSANSPFASALGTLMRQPGLAIEQIFNGVRLQVNQASNGAQTPWTVSALNVEVKLFDAPEPPKTLASACGVVGLPVPPLTRRHLTKASLREMSADAAYRLVIEEDWLQDYQWFVETYPHYRLAGQIWDIINQRREAILWHRTLTLGTTQAYWNYLDRYRNGIYAGEARAWLHGRAEPLPPSDYVPEPLDLPPGYYDEAVGVDYLVQQGYPAPPPVFGYMPPVYVPPPPRWTRQNTIIYVQQLAPPPRPQVYNNMPLVTPRPTTAPLVQPVPPIVNPLETPAQRQEKVRAIQAWQSQVKQRNESFARKYHVPAVTPTSAVTVPGERRPAPGIPPVPAQQGQRRNVPPTTTKPGQKPFMTFQTPKAGGAPSIPAAKPPAGGKPSGLAIPSTRQEQRPGVSAPAVRPAIPPAPTRQEPRPGAPAPTIRPALPDISNAPKRQEQRPGIPAPAVRSAIPAIPPAPTRQEQHPGVRAPSARPGVPIPSAQEGRRPNGAALPATRPRIAPTAPPSRQPGRPVMAPTPQQRQIEERRPAQRPIQERQAPQRQIQERQAPQRQIQERQPPKRQIQERQPQRPVPQRPPQRIQQRPPQQRPPQQRPPQQRPLQQRPPQQRPQCPPGAHFQNGRCVH